MNKLWCEEGDLKVFKMKGKMYQFVFTKEEERKRVLDKLLWNFDNQMLVLQPWRQGIESDPNTFSST